MTRNCHTGFAAIVLLFFMSVQTAHAACGTTPNFVTVSATTVSFGNYDPSSPTPVTANGTITASCLLGGNLPSFAVALSAGGGSFTTRQMSLLTQKLNYNLYTSSAYTTVWGDGTNGTVTQSYSASSNLANAVFTVFGSMPIKQYPSPGVYSDSITVTVTY